MILKYLPLSSVTVSSSPTKAGSNIFTPWQLILLTVTKLITQPEIMRLLYFEFKFTYTVALSIGQGRNCCKCFRLHLDMGSGLTWVQCIQRYPSFPTMDPQLEPTRSITYRHMPCNNQFFLPPKYRCVSNLEQFRYPNADNAYVSGDVAFEMLSTDSDQGPRVTKQKMLDHPREYFGSQHRLVEVDCEDHRVDSSLCYCLPTNWRSILPGMTWHFEQHADFYMENMKLFTIDFGRGIFYLMLKDGGLLIVVWVEQQINYCFIYDLRCARLKFAWEDCSTAP